MYQEMMPIRGKILNVEKASIDKVLANAEIKTMINAFGCGFSEGYGNDFDIRKLRYDKIKNFRYVFSGIFPVPHHHKGTLLSLLTESLCTMAASPHKHVLQKSVPA